MLKVNIPNARLLDDAVDNEEHSYLRGRDYYCHTTLGYGRLSKEYRACKAGERQADKGLSGSEKKGVAAVRKSGDYTSPSQDTTGGDWTTDDYVDNNGERSEGTYSGEPSADAKNNGGNNLILGMEKPVAIPVIVLSLAALTVGTILIVKKLKK